jgi:hypothetical protein
VSTASKQQKSNLEHWSLTFWSPYWGGTLLFRPACCVVCCCVGSDQAAVPASQQDRASVCSPPHVSVLTGRCREQQCNLSSLCSASIHPAPPSQRRSIVLLTESPGRSGAAVSNPFSSYHILSPPCSPYLHPVVSLYLV